MLTKTAAARPRWVIKTGSLDEDTPLTTSLAFLSEIRNGDDALESLTLFVPPVGILHVLPTIRFVKD